MSFLSINRGAQPNDNTGDNLREGARKINSNFSEIYSNLGDGTSILFNYNTYKLNQINDVNTVPQHDYVLQWNSTNSEWIAVGKLTGNVVGHMIPDANNVHDLGSANNNFRDFYIAGNTVFNPGEQRLFSDGTLKLQYNYHTSNALMFDSNTSTASAITHTTPSDDLVFTDTSQMDNVTVGTQVVYFFPGINVASGPPYSLMPSIVVELTLANTVAATSTTYTNYDETVYATPAASHNDAFYFSGTQTLTVKNGALAIGDGNIEDDLLGADIATLTINRVSSDGIGEVIISNKTQTLLNKTIPAANNTILMSIGHLVDVNIPSANAGDTLQWSNTSNSWVAGIPVPGNISGAIVNGHLLPAANDAFDLGSPTSQFKDLYMTGNSIHLGSTTISSVGGKVSFGGATLSAPLEITGHLIPDQNETYDLGNATHKFRDLYLSSATLNLGTSSLSVGSDGLTFTETAPVVLYKDTIQNVNPNLNSQYSWTDSITELGIVQSSDGTASARFGAPAISGNRIVVGTGMTGMSAYLFDSDGNELTKLVPNDTIGNFDMYSYGIDVSSNRVVVGAPGQTSGQGAVYIFDINGSQLNKIQSSDVLDWDSFGKAVAVSDTRIVVGAPDRQTQDQQSTLGVAYIFDSDGNELAKLQSDITDEDLSFGIKVAVSENYVLVSALSEDGGKGAVYMYTANGTLITKLKAPDGKSGDAFGNGLAINESLVAASRIVVGAYNEDSVAANSGAAYIFDIQGNFIKKIKAYDAMTDDRFGWGGIAVSDTRIAVGTYLKDKDSSTLNSGAVYIYDTLGNPLEKIEPTNVSAGDFYGNGVAITDTRLVVGATSDDTANTDAGSFYLYDIDPSATPVYQPQIFGINGLDGIGKTSDWPEAVIANNHILFSPETSFTAKLTLHEATGAPLHKFDLLPEGAGDWTDDPANGFTNIDTVNEGFIIDKFGKFWIKTPTNQAGFENYMQGVSFATFSILNIQNATPAKPLKPVDNPANIATTNVPSSATDTGTKGDIVVGNSYVYICKDTDQWVRIAIDTGW